MRHLINEPVCVSSSLELRNSGKVAKKAIQSVCVRACVRACVRMQVREGGCVYVREGEIEVLLAKHTVGYWSRSGKVCPGCIKKKKEKE